MRCIAYLRHGWHPDHGVARGPMAEVVSNLSSVPESDVRAIAIYMAGVFGAPAPDRKRRGEEVLAQAKSPAPQASQSQRRPARRSMPRPARPAMRPAGRCPMAEINLGSQHRDLSVPMRATLANIVLSGVRPVEGERSPIMPGFAASMNDEQIAALLNYLRARFSDQPAWTDTRKDRRGRAAHPDRISPDIARAAQRARRSNPARQAMMTLKVNGRDHQVDADPDTPLLYVLRDDLELNAAKFGCGLGQCGACTVIVDGKAVLSCVTPLLLLEGKQVTTLEGLGTIETPAPIQRAFMEEQAAQCGYCIAGMMMRAQALLQKNSKPTDDADPRRARAAICAAAAPICASCARCIARPG